MKKRNLICLLLLLLLPSLLLAAEISLPAMYGESYYAELPEMVQRLNDAQGNRIILIGGSSVPFGTDTQLLHDALNDNGFSYTVCPMGLYAAVGTSAMLDLTKNELRSGDIVILTFEPTSETMSTYFGANAFWKCAESTPSLLTALSKDRLAAMVGAYPGYLQERWTIHQSGNYPKADGVYARSSFDEVCNLIYPREGNAMTLGYDISEPIDLGSLTIAEDFAVQVNDFIAAAEKKNAQVYLSFAPMNRSAMVDTSEETVLAYFNQMHDTFHCRIISNPNDSILDSGWFYDSNFHLNSSGAQLRTQRLSADLLAELGYFQPLGFEEPEMPASIAVTAATAGDSVFTFSPIDDGLLISGLTETAFNTLTVPSHHDGLPVVGFTAGALDEARELEELRLPASIQSLPDGIFRNCTSLSRLILEHTDSLCSITEHSLDGTKNVKILVPQDAYHLYRDGIGCEQNLWSNYLNQIITY